MGTGFKFTPMLVLPLPEMRNSPEVPKAPVDVLAGGNPPVAEVPVPEFMLIPPIPPMRLLAPVAELPPDAIVDTGLIECPLVKGVLGAPTTLAMIKNGHKVKIRFHTVITTNFGTFSVYNLY